MRKNRGTQRPHAIGSDSLSQNRLADVAQLDDADSCSGGDRSSGNLGETMQKQQPQQESPTPAIADSYSRLEAQPNDKGRVRQPEVLRQVPLLVMLQLITAAGRSSTNKARCAEKGKGKEARPAVTLFAQRHLRCILWWNK